MFRLNPKPLSELQEESHMTNRIMGQIADNESRNSTMYTKEKHDPEEFYYTTDEPFKRTENYTINGEPVSKYLRGRDGK